MKRNEDKNYEFKFDPKKDLEEYDLLHETKVLLEENNNKIKLVNDREKANEIIKAMLNGAATADV